MSALSTRRRNLPFLAELDYSLLFNVDKSMRLQDKFDVLP